MYIVYAIYNQKQVRVYIGQTRDLQDRIRMHNDNSFAKSYTARFDGEWRLIYQEGVSDRRAALLREKQLKSFRGREFVKQHIPR